MTIFNYGTLSSRATSVLCALLMLHLTILTPGCGHELGGGLIENGKLIIPLTADHPITQSLHGTAFEGAHTMEVDIAQKTFRMLFPEQGRAISGKFTNVGNGWEMTNFFFETTAGAGEMVLDPVTRQVMMIELSNGQTWQPSKDAVVSARAHGGDQLDGYLASNAELIELSSKVGEKTNSSFPFFLFFVPIMIIWMLCANSILTCPGFIPIFAVIAAILGSIPPPGAPAPLPTNNPPDAQNDAFTTPRNTAVEGNVLSDNGSGADTDPDGNPLTTTLTVQPTSGAVSLQNTGAFTYTPNTGFVGTDTFTYQLNDGQGGIDTAVVTITVVNQPPDARNDAFTTLPDGPPLVGNLFANNGSGADSDPDGGTLTVIAVNGIAANVGVEIVTVPPGMLTVTAGGTFTFINAGFSGVVTFTYTISDGQGGTDTATATITIVPPP